MSGWGREMDVSIPHTGIKNLRHGLTPALTGCRSSFNPAYRDNEFETLT
ncbi:MAG: hypothetical protein NZL92_11700 [Gloeomargarita sp. SKYG116]|nr:hypothetical protein [Gloeomargarita sp. SKYG116]MDW8402346.1 hypothetical protein [Gloeomargarita sp. SKYGB_i_bin116]